MTVTSNVSLERPTTDSPRPPGAAGDSSGPAA